MSSEPRWSALQLEPQGANGATLAMMNKNCHASLPGYSGRRASARSPCDGRQVVLEQIEHETGAKHCRQAGNTKVSQPVRNTQSGIWHDTIE
jgi:hypothetical protein